MIFFIGSSYSLYNKIFPDLRTVIVGQQPSEMRASGQAAHQNRVHALPMAYEKQLPHVDDGTLSQHCDLLDEQQRGADPSLSVLG